MRGGAIAGGEAFARDDECGCVWTYRAIRLIYKGRGTKEQEG